MTALKEKLIALAENADLFCDSNDCSFCFWANAETDNDISIEVVCQEIVEKAEQGRCEGALKVKLSMKGSLFHVRGFCFRCQSQSALVRKNYNSLSVQSIAGVVNIDNFSIPGWDNIENMEPTCTRHNQAVLDIQCFGDLPTFCVLKSSNTVSGPLIQDIMPLRYTRDFQDTRSIINPTSTFLGKGFYVGNPCYNSSFPMATVHIVWSTVGESASYYLLRFKDSLWDETRWSLEEVADSKPFFRRTGPYKILESISSAIGPMDRELQTAFLPQRTKSPGISRIRLTPENLRRTSRPDEPVSDSESGTASTSDTEASDIPSDFVDDGKDIIDDVSLGRELSAVHLFQGQNELGRKMRTSIPFLSASYPFLWANGYQNPHYMENDDGGMTFQEALHFVSSRNVLCSPGISIKELVKVDIAKEALLSSKGESLSLSCDVDSIDMISKPWGGIAFCGSRVRISSLFTALTREPAKYLARNNNMVNFQQNERGYPGAYFLSKSFQHSAKRRDADEKDCDPIAVRIFDVKTSFSMHNLKVRAIIPSGSVACIADTHRYATDLFRRVVSGERNEIGRGKRVSDRENRNTLHAMFWFMIKEVLLLMLSLVSHDVQYPRCNSRLPCCAVVSAGNSCNHDRNRGPNSSVGEGTDVTSEDAKLGFLLASRLIAAIEQMSNLPEEFRTFNDVDESIYSVPEELLDSVEDEDTLQCLRLPIGDEGCLQFFRDKVWTGERAFGGLLRLESDSNRRGRDALPNMGSNKKAWECGSLVLEDLLPLAPVAFKVTEHGMKCSFRSSSKGMQVKHAMESEFRLQAVCDGIVDIAFTLNGPHNSRWAVLLPESTARKSKLLVPVETSRRSFRQLNGMLFCSPGYPNFVGFSTENGRVGKRDSVLQLNGVRRVKCYSENRRFDATRGTSVCGISAKPLEEELRNASQLTSEWMQMRPTATQTAGARAAGAERRRQRYMNIITHDIERRSEAACNSRTGFGIRFEVTASCSSIWDVMDDAINLLKVREERKTMSESEFEAQFKRSPEKWPWFTRIPLVQEKVRRSTAKFEMCAELLPVTLVSSSGFVELNTSIEKSLVSSAQNFYLSCKSNVCGDDSDLPSNRCGFFDEFLRAAPAGIGVNLGLLISRALLRSASYFVDSGTCRFSDLSLRIPPFVMSACGLDVSHYYGGIPQILWSRVLGIDDRHEQLLRRMDHRNCEMVKKLKTAGTEMMDICSQFEEDMNLPDALHLSARISQDGFAVHVLFGGVPGEIFSVAENGYEEHRSRRRLYILMTSLFQDASGPKSMLRNSAVAVALLLLSDCCVELGYMLGSSSARFLTKEDISAHKLRSYPDITVGLVRTLAPLSREKAEWPPERRIDTCSVQEEIENVNLEYRMNGLLQFYRKNNEGLTSVGDDVADIRSSLTDEDGTVPMDRFIRSLWERSGYLPHFSELVDDRRRPQGQRETASFHNWRSIIALRIIEGLLEEENQRIIRVSRHARNLGSSELKQVFLEHFPRYLAEAFTSVGLLNLCPLLTDSLPSDTTDGQRAWGPMPIFTILTNADEDLTPLRRDFLGLASVNEQGRDVGLRILQDRDTRIDSFKNFAISYKNATKRLAELTKIAESPSEKHDIWIEFRRQQTKFWSNQVLGEMVSEYLGSVRERMQESLKLNQVSYDYSLRILEFLRGVRRQIGDEGMGVFRWRPANETGTELRSVMILRDGNERQLEAAEEAFSTDIDLRKKPFGSVGYPKPTEKRDETATKRIIVRSCSRLLFESGLVFKHVRLPRKKCTLDFEKYKGVAAGRIYRRYLDRDVQSCQRSHSMWRLVPDLVFVNTLLRYCQGHQ